MSEYEKGEKEPLAHGVKLRAKLKRGTGTRDQDEILIEGRGEDIEEAIENFEAGLSAAEAGEWVHRLRSLQPVVGGESSDE